MKIRTYKKANYLWALLFLLILAAIVYAAGMPKGLATAFTTSSTQQLEARQKYLSAFDVMTSDEKQPTKAAQEDFAQLIQLYSKAGASRKGDGKVPDKIKKESNNIANGLKSIYENRSKAAKSKDLKSVAKLYAYSGESIVIQTDVHVKDEVCRKDVDKIKKRNKKEKKLLDAAYKEVQKKISLDAKQQKHLRDVSLAAFKKDLEEVQKLLGSINTQVAELQKEIKKKGVFGTIKSLGSGCEPLDVFKAIIDSLKSLIENIKLNILNLTKLSKS